MHKLTRDTAPPYYRVGSTSDHTLNSLGLGTGLGARFRANTNNETGKSKELVLMVEKMRDCLGGSPLEGIEVVLVKTPKSGFIVTEMVDKPPKECAGAALTKDEIREMLVALDKLKKRNGYAGYPSVLTALSDMIKLLRNKAKDNRLGKECKKIAGQMKDQLKDVLRLYLAFWELTMIYADGADKYGALFPEEDVNKVRKQALVFKRDFERESAPLRKEVNQQLKKEIMELEQLKQQLKNDKGNDELKQQIEEKEALILELKSKIEYKSFIVVQVYRARELLKDVYTAFSTA